MPCRLPICRQSKIVVDTSEHYAIRQDNIPRKDLPAFSLLVPVMPLCAADEEGPQLM
jgi:hypothetical protein